MFALIIVANPNTNSLSHAMANIAHEILIEKNYHVSVHDLYAERFDPVQPTGEIENVNSKNALVEEYCSELARADFILISHPNWWGQPPAILKGWVDRVFRLNTAYGYPSRVGYDGIPEGLLRARCAMIVNTSNTPMERESATFGVRWKRSGKTVCLACVVSLM